MNEQVVNKGVSFFPAFLYCTHMKKDGDRGRQRMKARVAWKARSVAWLPTTRSIGGGPLDGNRQWGEKGEGGCARLAGKKRCAHSPAVRRSSSAGARSFEPPVEARHLATESPTGGPHASVIFKFQKKLKNPFLLQKIRYKVRKNMGKFMEVGNPIWNNFHDYNFLRFSTNFELFQRF
jgi:hypothetical protein